MSGKIEWLGAFGVKKYWVASGGAVLMIFFSAYSHQQNRLLNRMIEQQYWSEDENKMHSYFRIKNLERGRLLQDDDEFFRLKLLDAAVKKYPMGLNPRSGWRKHTLIYNAKVRGKLPPEWIDGDPWPWEAEFRQRFPDFEIASGDYGKVRIGKYGMISYDRDERNIGPKSREEAIARREKAKQAEYDFEHINNIEIRGDRHMGIENKFEV